MIRQLRTIRTRLKISDRAMKVFGTVGFIISLLSFWANDLFGSVNYALYSTNETMSTAAFLSGIKLYAVGILFMAVYVAIGVIVSIISTELFIKVCDLYNYKPKIYKFLTQDENCY